MRRFFWFLLLLTVALSGSCKNDDLSSGQQPILSGMTPAQAHPGQQNVEGRISGNHFNGIVAVNLGQGINIHDTNAIDSTQIAVRYSVANGAAAGPRTITVTTLAGSVTNATVFSVSNNKAPQAKFHVDRDRAGINDPFSFDASNSDDPDGRVMEYIWEFGDGKTGRGKTIEHRYESPNRYTVRLTVKDNKEGTSAALRDLEVLNSRSPVPHFNITPPRGNVETVFKFDGNPSTDDKRIVSYVWKFGDGRRDEGRVARHKFRSAQTFDVELTVTDNDGLKSSTTKKLEIIGKPPVARFNVTPGSSSPGKNVVFDSSESSDPDGHIVSRAWDFGDGKTSSGARVGHAFGRTGNFNVKLTVTDNSGMKDTASRTISVSNAPPPPPPPPPGGGGGGRCTNPADKGRDLYGTVVSVDAGRKIVTVRLDSPHTCATAFYKCGDLKKGDGIRTPYEYWYGAICRMDYLGNSTFRLYLVRGNGLPSPGERGVYLHWQPCTLNWCNAF